MKEDITVLNLSDEQLEQLIHFTGVRVEILDIELTDSGIRIYAHVKKRKWLSLFRELFNQISRNKKGGNTNE